MTQARVLCVDDSPDIIELMVRLISREHDLRSVGAVEQADGLQEAVERTGADVVLLDLHMPGADPLHELAKLRASGSSCRVIVMSGRDDPETISAAMAAGATKFVNKDAGAAEIIRAIRIAGSAAGGGS